MEQNNPVLPNDGGQSGQSYYGHFSHGGHYHDPHIRVPFTNIQRPPPPHFCHFRPRGFPFPPVHPFMYGPPVFSAPPPPSSCFLESAEVTSLEPNDKIWLSNFLQARSCQQPSRFPDKKGASIYEARDKLKLWLQLLKDLKGKFNNLQNGINDISLEEWDSIIADVGKSKSAISSFKSLHFSEKSLQDLQKKLLSRSKKRCRQKSQIAKEKKNAYLDQLKRQSLHHKADMWLADMQLAVERARKDEELKREADAVLAEVTRRQSEGRRQVALLEALQKLHQARLQTSEVRGSRLSTEEKQSAEHSLITIGKLLAMWSRKMDEYTKEEHGLRVMLEESAAKQSDQEIEKVRHILSKWETCLFGSDYSRTPDEPSDIDTLVSIRYAWDQYLAPDTLVPLASTIPVGWVFPTTPSSPEWQKLLLR